MVACFRSMCRAGAWKLASWVPFDGQLMMSGSELGDLDSHTRWEGGPQLVNVSQLKFICEMGIVCYFATRELLTDLDRSWAD